MVHVSSLPAPWSPVPLPLWPRGPARDGRGWTAPGAGLSQPRPSSPSFRGPLASRAGPGQDTGVCRAGHKRTVGSRATARAGGVGGPPAGPRGVTVAAPCRPQRGQERAGAGAAHPPQGTDPLAAQPGGHRPRRAGQHALAGLLPRPQQAAAGPAVRGVRPVRVPGGAGAHGARVHGPRPRPWSPTPRGPPAGRTRRR